MTTQTGEMTLEDAAAKLAGNWQHFDSFFWNGRHEVESPEDCAIIYTHNRDSGLLDESNASVIHKALGQFADGDSPDIRFESHAHWAVGHVDGFSIRVLRGGEITPAFRAYHELMEQIADYPVLDESDYCEREYAATIENITDAARSLKSEFVLPDGWEGEVYSWLSDNCQSAIENTDDQGGYPGEDDLLIAMETLFERVAD